MKTLLVAVVALAGLHFTVSAQDSTARESVAATVPPALRFLEQKAVAWKDEYGCATCHHAPMMLWSCETAKTKGFEVNEEALATIRGFILDENNAAKLFPPDHAPPETSGTQIGSIYALLALQSGPDSWEGSTLVAKTRTHFAAEQREDGSWPPFPLAGRPPILEQNGASARLLVAMLGGMPAEAVTPESAAAVEKAKAWLAQPLENPSHQIEVFQFLAEMATGAPQATLEARVASLLAQQRPDGSWAQTPDMAGDALATGQTLYALGKAGRRLGYPAVDRAAAFLKERQEADGVWPMVSRPVVGGPADGMTEESKNKEPIVCMAAGWAVVGMLTVY